MPILTCTGNLLPRNGVHSKSIKQSRKNKKKRRRLIAKTAKCKYRLTKKQASMIIDRQITRKLQRMF